MDNTADIALPPLPAADYMDQGQFGYIPTFTADTLEAYARSAVAADREAGRAGDAGGVSGSEYFKIGLLEWGVAGWRSEVANRPLVNIHRERLDAFWRNVIIKAGVDPDSIIGPSHAELLAAAAPQPPRVDKSAEAADDASTAARFARLYGIVRRLRWLDLGIVAIEAGSDSSAAMQDLCSFLFADGIDKAVSGGPQTAAGEQP